LAANEAAKMRDSARIFKYAIKENYDSTATNNKVYLKIIDKNGNEYDTTKYFNFSSQG
jgi:hypothetical protein